MYHQKSSDLLDSISSWQTNEHFPKRKCPQGKCSVKKYYANFSRAGIVLYFLIIVGRAIFMKWRRNQVWCQFSNPLGCNLCCFEEKKSIFLWILGIILCMSLMLVNYCCGLIPADNYTPVSCSLPTPVGWGRESEG